MLRVLFFLNHTVQNAVLVVLVLAASKKYLLLPIAMLPGLHGKHTFELYLHVFFSFYVACPKASPAPQEMGKPGTQASNGCQCLSTCIAHV